MTKDRPRWCETNRFFLCRSWWKSLFQLIFIRAPFVWVWRRRWTRIHCSVTSRASTVTFCNTNPAFAEWKIVIICVLSFRPGSYDHTVKMYDTRSGSSVLTLQHGHPVESVLLNPTGGVLLSAGAYLRPLRTRRRCRGNAFILSLSFGSGQPCQKNPSHGSRQGCFRATEDWVSFRPQNSYDLWQRWICLIWCLMQKMRSELFASKFTTYLCVFRDQTSAEYTTPCCYFDLFERMEQSLNNKLIFFAS